MSLFRLHIILVVMLAWSSRSQAQVECPHNIDFEQGNFSGWELRWGTVTAINGFNELIFDGFGANPNRYTLITAPDTTTDFYGKFPRLCPNGSRNSVVLGNDGTGGQAESLSYEFSVPTGVADYSIFFHYAVVFEDPSHGTIQQPRFRARLLNALTGEAIECVNFDFTASGSLPGFQESPVKPNVYYKGWTPITLDLTPFAGERLRLEFITSDCTLQGHFGYAYVDVTGICSGAVSGTVVCEGDASGTLTAPFGFLSYTWYSDLSFSTVLSTDQSLTLTPPPAVGTVYPVVLEPFPGFGCPDTAYATISSAPKPIAIAGADRTLCTYQTTQLGQPPEPGRAYSWEPRENLVGHQAANPLTLANLTGPTAFVLTVTDLSSGCQATDDVVVTPVMIDTTLAVTGDLIFCDDDDRNTSLRVSNPSESVQWYANSSPVTGASGWQYDPLPQVTTRYFAEIWKQGCRDSTREVIVHISPDPVASFRAEKKMQCSQIPIKFLNNSFISTTDTLLFTWRLASGVTFSEKDLVTIFDNAGPQAISLLAESGFGCKDSLTLHFNIVDNCHVNVPTAFTPNNDGLNDLLRPSLNGIKMLRRFEVYDRWGNVVYRTTREEEGWDGRFRGTLLDTGVYVWLLEYDTYEKDNVVMKGTVTLIR